MATAELTIRLPQEDLEFAERYAREHRMTLAELIDRYLRRLRRRSDVGIHPEVERISGILPEIPDARLEHRAHLLEKHTVEINRAITRCSTC